MKQIKIFKVPEEVAQANDFLAKTPPESVATISKGEQCFVFVNYDDQSYPAGYIADELKGLMLSNTKENMTSEISVEVMGVDLVLYEDKLKLAEEELTRLETEEAPVTSKKEKYDWEKLQGEKVLAQKEIVAELKQSVGNIKNGIQKLGESIVRVNAKKAVLQKKLDALNTN